MTLSIIVPCYNEEAVLHETNARLTDVIKRMEAKALIDHGRIMYVNDGSADRTWQIVEELAQADQTWAACVWPTTWDTSRHCGRALNGPRHAAMLP